MFFFLFNFTIEEQISSEGGFQENGGRNPGKSRQNRELVQTKKKEGGYGRENDLRSTIRPYL